MTVINDYFSKKTDKVSFVELKKGSHIRIKDYIVKDHIPLPIATNRLINEIKKGNLHEGLKVAHLIDGIIFILGIDCNFKYKEEYKKIIYNYNPRIEEYILYRGLKFIEENNYEDGAIFFRALTNINAKNVEGIFNYALSLENIAKDYINRNKEDEGKKFLMESTKQLETILDIDEDFSLAYYKLGYHYKYYGQFHKAKLIWEKYIKLSKDEELIQEIREELDLIADDANYEEGINHLSKGEYDKALDNFLSLMNRYSEWWNLLYLTGLAYKGIGDYEKAIEFFYKALEEGGKEINIYNELGICLFGMGNINEAIEIFSKGIDLYDQDYKIIFNRGLAYLQVGLRDKAIEDIKKAYKLNPEDEWINKQVKLLNIEV
ncbi:MAG: tetratricopeptide repeat protein [Tissierellia bacterium]|nr:tetratricopeptide repeat protein [Tissierellia bacterium]